MNNFPVCSRYKLIMFRNVLCPRLLTAASLRRQAADTPVAMGEGLPLAAAFLPQGYPLPPWPSGLTNSCPLCRLPIPQSICSSPAAWSASAPSFFCNPLVGFPGLSKAQKKHGALCVCLLCPDHPTCCHLCEVFGQRSPRKDWKVHPRIPKLKRCLIHPPNCISAQAFLIPSPNSPLSLPSQNLPTSRKTGENWEPALSRWSDFLPQFFCLMLFGLRNQELSWFLGSLSEIPQTRGDLR